MVEIQEKKQLDFAVNDFNGPLDLLLHLIKESKVEIEDIFISDVTEQFLKYIESLDRLDLETASDFLTMASTLLEIKSKALLPRYEQLQNEDEIDEGALLIRRLEEYKLIKEASISLKEIEDVGKFYREADKSTKDVKIEFNQSDVNLLVEAFSKLLIMEEEHFQRSNLVEKIIPKDNTTVEERSEFIVKTLKSRGKTSLFALFTEKPTKIRLVITLLAMLELIKNGEIKISQSQMFCDVDIELCD